MAGLRKRLKAKVGRLLQRKKEQTTTATASTSSESQSLVPPDNNTPGPQAPGLSTDLGLLTETQEPNTAASLPPESPRSQTPAVLRAGNASNTPAITQTVAPTPDPSIPQSQIGLVLLLPPSNRDNTTSLWIKAFQMLSEEDKALLPSARNDPTEEFLKDIKNHADLCAQGAWRVKYRGNEIAVRDVVDKILVWVDKFKSIGDIAIQYDPAHAALPWAGIRFLLQIALSNKENMGVMMASTERVARLVVRGAVYEGLYLGSESTVSTPLRTGLANGLLDLYLTVLRFLACAKRYLVQPSAARVLRSIVDIGQIKPSVDTIEEREILLEMDLKTAEREEKAREMERFFGEIDSTIMLFHDEFRAYIDGQRKDEVLKWLSTIEFIKHHQTAREGLLENTGRWLLEREQFRQWRSSGTSGILWLHGIPGAGKTKLTLVILLQECTEMKLGRLAKRWTLRISFYDQMCMVIEFLQSLPQSEGPVVYFYCKRDDPQRRSPEVIMQAILKHLCLALKNLPNMVVQEYDKRKEKGHAAGSLGFTECRNLVASLLNVYSHTTIVIDALDESDPDDRWRLLESFENIIDSATSPVKIFVSSRDDTDIKRRLGKVPNHYIDAKDNTGDIERFVVREVTSAIDQKRLLYGTISDSLREKIIHTVAERSNGMFQWADLQIKNLYRLKLPEEIEESLGKLPKTLEATYSQMWRDILGETTEAQRKITEKAFMWLICSLEPLDPKAWAEFTYWPAAVPQNGVDVLFDLCRNLTRWDKQVDRVVFAHLSVQEFFESRIFKPVQANSMAAKSCLSLLTDSDWLRSLEEEQERLLLFVSYSDKHWAGHVDLCYNAEQHMGNGVRDSLLLFLGTRAEPSQSYSKWLDRDPFPDPIRKLSYGDNTIHLLSRPLEPLFAISYFRFGEVLLPEFERGLSRIDINTRNGIGETLLHFASYQGNERVMDFLLEKEADVNTVAPRFDGGTDMNTPSDSPLYAAIINRHSGAVLKLLAKGATITRENGNRVEALVAVASLGSRDLIEKLSSAYTGLKITEAVLVAAAGNHLRGREVLEVLLPICPDTAITEAVLVAAAGNHYCGHEVLEVLLPRCHDTAITEAILVAAAGNHEYCDEVLKVLLPICPDTAITEAVLVAAAGHRIYGGEVLKVLLARCPDTAITEAVLVAAAGDSYCSCQMMKLLLPRCPDTALTEAAMIVGTMGYYAQYCKSLLISRRSEINITKAAIKPAAVNPILQGAVGQYPDSKTTQGTPIATERNIAEGGNGALRSLTELDQTSPYQLRWVSEGTNKRTIA
ncbi:hypothetical protein DFP73DRAFT_599118 [Morchella snyderi]|nr:hypothetical protein DFP73DRAFT_599118 [Morchella snyderi]